jgi:hypothetical protein
MPIFAAKFDGADLRHQLYVLALTHFQPVYTNYFERPELHKLYNRSGELWLPLVALAAFFEEQGGIRNLLSAISDAATWDDQMSEGKSLSDREEAVLQALEILTRPQPDWIKAGDLREQVRDVLGYSHEQMGNTQWIGHILNRLHLSDRNRRKAYSGGQMYNIKREDVLDMIERYDVSLIERD